MSEILGANEPVRYSTDMTAAQSVEAALQSFYARSGLDGGEAHDRWVSIYAGCLYVAVPNIEARRNLVQPHDIHHVLGGYGIDRIGEGEVAAWELGTGTWRRPLVMLMNLMAFSTGYLHDRERIRQAFLAGCQCHNLYGVASYEALKHQRLESVREQVQRAGTSRWARLRRFELACYVAVSFAIHAALLAYGGVAHVLGKKMVWLGPLPPGTGDHEIRRLIASGKLSG